MAIIGDFPIVGHRHRGHRRFIPIVHNEYVRLNRDVVIIRHFSVCAFADETKRKIIKKHGLLGRNTHRHYAKEK